MAKITSKKTVASICKIYINKKLHLLFDEKKINAIQSWVENDNKYVVELSMMQGNPIVCEYDNPALWESILNEIDKLI